MLKTEVVRKLKVEKVARAIEKVLVEFNKSLNGQINLSAPAAQRDVANAIASHLDGKGMIGNYPSRTKE